MDVDEAVSRQWAHSPSHVFLPGGAYIVTAGTYRKAALFNTPEKRDFLQGTLFQEADRFGWLLQAWAVMPNHYHVVAHAPTSAGSLKGMICAIHSRTAVWLNKKDRKQGRKVWFQCWDTCLTWQKSYLARLNYVHHNAVRHGLADSAEDYPWCSMGWFRRNAEPAFVRTVLSFEYDRVRVKDDF